MNKRLLTLLNNHPELLKYVKQSRNMERKKIAWNLIVNQKKYANMDLEWYKSKEAYTILSKVLMKLVNEQLGGLPGLSSSDCEHTDIQTYISTNGKNSFIKKAFSTLFNQLKSFHEENIIHGDIALSNIVYCGENKKRGLDEDSTHLFKFIDFKMNKVSKESFLTPVEYTFTHPTIYTKAASAIHKYVLDKQAIPQDNSSLSTDAVPEIQEFTLTKPNLSDEEFNNIYDLWVTLLKLNDVFMLLYIMNSIYHHDLSNNIYSIDNLIYLSTKVPIKSYKDSYFTLRKLDISLEEQKDIIIYIDHLFKNIEAITLSKIGIQHEILNQLTDIANSIQQYSIYFFKSNINSTHPNNVYIINGHGAEIPTKFTERVKIPKDTILVVFPICSLSTHSSDLYMFEKLLNIPVKYKKEKLKKILENPVKYRREIEELLHITIRIYSPGQYVPNLITNLFIDNSYENNKTLIHKSGVYNINNFPLFDFSIPGLQKEINPYNAIVDIPKKSLRTVYTKDIHNEIYRGNLYKPASDNYHPVKSLYQKHKLIDILTTIGPGVYYYFGCRGLLSNPGETIPVNLSSILKHSEEQQQENYDT